MSSDDHAPPEAPAASPDAADLALLLESVPAFVIRADSDLRIRYMNRTQPGFTREHVLGRSVFEFVDPRYRPLHAETIERVRTSGQPANHVIVGDGPNGAKAYYQTSVVPMQTADGGQDIALIAVDVTQHVAHAEALRENEERLRLVVGATGMGLWSYDVRTGHLDWDERMREITGHATPLHPADYVELLVHPDDREAVRASAALTASGKPDFRVHRLVRPDGELRWVHPVGAVLRDAEGRPTQVLGGMLDVTAEHRARERLEHIQRMDAVGSLTAGVAHNFNNMLSVILPALEIAERGVPPARRSLMQDAVTAARHAAELVSQLMTFAGQRQNEDKRRVVDLREVLGAAVGMCRHTFGRQCVLSCEQPPEPVFVLCGAGSIEQVLVNLLINARDAVRDAGRSPGRIRVRLDRQSPKREQAARQAGAFADCAHISVVDDGVGMSREIQRRLFQPFFTTKDPGSGTGLGLATSYAIVHAHGGSLQCESEPDAGTTFHVYLPSAAAAPSEASPPQRGEAAPQGRVLVVDDERVVRSAVAETLRDAGFEVALAASVREAIDALQAGPPPGVVLLDRSMPEAKGREAVPHIRRLAPHAAIVYFSGLDIPPDELREVDAALAKPATGQQLLEAVQRHCGRVGAAHATRPSG